MYSDLIVEHFTDPKHVGDLDNHDVEFEIGNSVCGDKIRIQFSHSDDVVTNITFRAWGCATSVATADIFCSSILQKSQGEISKRTDEEIESMLGTLDPSQHHCVHILQELHQKLTKEFNVGVA